MGHTSLVCSQLINYFNFLFSVVSQGYKTGCHEVYVILGNSALLKCEIPSFVADFVSVVSWIDNDAVEYFPSNNNGIQIEKVRFRSGTQAIFYQNLEK